MLPQRQTTVEKPTPKTKGKNQKVLHNLEDLAKVAKVPEVMEPDAPPIGKAKAPEQAAPAPSPSFILGQPEYQGVIIDILSNDQEPEWIKISAVSPTTGANEVFQGAVKDIVGLTPELGMVVSFKLRDVHAGTRKYTNAFYVKEVKDKVQGSLGKALISMREFLHTSRKDVGILVTIHQNDVLSQVHKYLLKAKSIPSDHEKVIAEAYAGTGLTYMGPAEHPFFLTFLKSNETP